MTYYIVDTALEPPLRAISKEEICAAAAIPAEAFETPPASEVFPDLPGLIVSQIHEGGALHKLLEADRIYFGRFLAEAVREFRGAPGEQLYELAVSRLAAWVTQRTLRGLRLETVPKGAGGGYQKLWRATVEPGPSVIRWLREARLLLAYEDEG